jgi:putative mRNA 3-end processing factor
VFGDINAWWRGNAERGITSIMLGYSLGKAQRIIKYLDRGVGDVVCYSTISETNRVLEVAGFDFGAWVDGAKGLDAADYRIGGLSQAMLVCPPAAIKSPWMLGLERFAVANCSGWMAVKKSREWGAMDQGFVLSDHADWPQLLGAVLATGAENVYVTHGFSEAFSRHLRVGYGLNAGVAEVMMRGDEGR